jgi:hypothetical protein
MTILRSPPRFWARFSVAAFGVVAIVGTLQSRGMCISTGRFYSDHEFRQMAINELLIGRHGGTTACETESRQSRGTTCGPKFEVKYGIASLKDYIEENPDCCKVHSGYSDQYGRSTNPEFYHYLLGLRYRFFDASWPVATVFSETNERIIANANRSFAISHCGGFRSVQSALESKS